MIIACFNSYSKYFDKEKSGSKCNTVREIDLEDERFQDLIRSMHDNDYSDIYIKIQEVFPFGNKNSFVRKITDISIWRNLMIISWEHSED